MCVLSVMLAAGERLRQLRDHRRHPRDFAHGFVVVRVHAGARSMAGRAQISIYARQSVYPSDDLLTRGDIARQTIARSNPHRAVGAYRNGLHFIARQAVLGGISRPGLAIEA